MSIRKGNKIIAGGGDLGNFVRLTGDETINGTKTFIVRPIVMTGNADSRYISKLSNYELGGTVPQDNIAGGVLVRDKNDAEIGNFFAGITTYGYSRSGIFIRQPVSSNPVSNQIYIECDTSGNFKTYTPTPAASNATSNNANITNVEWVNNPSKSTNVVHRTGNETIGGTKTFSNILTIKTAGPDRTIRLIDNNMDIDANPSSYISKAITIEDKNEIAAGQICSIRRTDGSQELEISSTTGNTNDEYLTNSVLKLTAKRDGTTSTWITSPPSNSNDNSIATTAFVNSKIQFVNSLPSNPVSGVLYLIPE